MLKAIFSALLIVIVCAKVSQSSVPVFNLDNNSLGIGYSGNYTGQLITDNDLPSQLKTHYLMLYYAPWSFLVISGGAGADIFKVQGIQSDFNGKSGFSFNGGLMLLTPQLAQFINFYAGMEASYVNSLRFDQKYNGALYNPYLGLSLFSNKISAISLGVKLHKANLYYSTPGSPEVLVTNSNPLRGFAALTLHSKEEKAFLSAAFDFSGAVKSDWRNGPYEAAVTLKAGVILRHDQRVKNEMDKSLEFFPEYEQMKERRDRMVEEIK